MYSSIQSTETPIAKQLKTLPNFASYTSGLSGVDCIYVINLDHRMKRWLRMIKLLNQHSLQPHRFSAIYGLQLPEQIRQELFGPYLSQRRLSNGIIGCCLSHLSVMQDAYNRQFQVVWVMEDDIEILEDVRQLPPILKTLSSIDPEWDICYTDVDSKDQYGNRILSLSSDFHPDTPHMPLEYYTERIPLNNDLMQIHQRFGMYSYFISRKGLEKVLRYFTHVYLWSAIDVDIHYVPSIREYSTRRDIVSVHYEAGDVSDIR